MKREKKLEVLQSWEDLFGNPPKLPITDHISEQVPAIVTSLGPKLPPHPAIYKLFVRHHISAFPSIALSGLQFLLSDQLGGKKNGQQSAYPMKKQSMGEMYLKGDGSQCKGKS